MNKDKITNKIGTYRKSAKTNFNRKFFASISNTYNDGCTVDDIADMYASCGFSDSAVITDILSMFGVKEAA